MKNYIFLSSKRWHDILFEKLSSRIDEKWYRIEKKEDFNYLTIEKINPEKIFIPHWSYLIPEDIFDNFECIVFHMTDLPYGRGGSPLQNLILEGKLETIISAIKVDKGIDTGPVYVKEKLSLQGSASEIFERSCPIILNMIESILKHNPEPKPQIGTPVHFKRRKPEESNIRHLDNLNKIYDFIRMLDCEGYPNAFIESDYFKFEFSKAIKTNNEIIANVRIIKK